MASTEPGRPSGAPKAAAPTANADMVEIHTDGGCSGNPGPGGWGAVLRWRRHERELSGFEPETTNNRMELMAAIGALESLKRPMQVRLVTDSTYLRKGITEWVRSWKARGWKTADKKPVKNVDLWQRLEEAARRHTIDWAWTKGHAGHALNERADVLATQAIKDGVAAMNGHATANGGN